MKLSQLGEQKVIETIRKRFASQGSGLLVGIGDDAAVLRPSTAQAKNKDQLLATDVLVEGVDFDLGTQTWHSIGFKALAVNLSDMAAMGGVARYYLATLGLPRDRHIEELEEIFEGMADLAQEFGVKLIGGDLSSVQAGGLFVSVTVMGEVERGRALVRSGAKAGDEIFVTGTLGDSAAGLHVTQALSCFPRRKRPLKKWLPLIQRHFYPVPRLSAGQLMCKEKIPSAMIDLSDGLASDLRHLCQASNMGAEIEAQELPLSLEFLDYTKEQGLDPLALSLTGGEDFELLLTVPPRRVDALAKLAKNRRFALRRIGRILPRARGLRLKNQQGRLIPLPSKGYEHFS